MIQPRRGGLIRTTATLIVVGLMVLGPAPIARADTLMVTTQVDTPVGSCDAVCSLREAVVTANATVGADTIVLPAGTYTLTLSGSGENAAATGDLDVTAPITIRGSSATTTTIDGNGTDRVLDVRAGSTGVTVQDLTITGGLSPADDAPAGGGGIRNASDLALERVVISSNTTGTTAEACCGGGIGNRGGSLTIADSTLSDNHSPWCCGGAVYNDGGGTVTIDRSTITENDTLDCCGGAVYQQDDDSSIVIRGSTVSGNEAPWCCGGAVFSSGDGDVTVEDTLVEDNSTDIWGGAVYVDDGTTARITRSTFRTNATTDDCCGGAVYGDWQVFVGIEDSTFEGNSVADCCGGAVYVLNGYLRVNGGAFRGNSTASCCGGAIWYAETSSYDAILDGVGVVDNSAGGGSGGGLFNDGSMEVRDSTISRNDAGACCGGGIHNADQMTIDRTTFEGNEAGGSGTSTGGGLYETGISTITNSTFSGNVADQGGGIHLDGSLLYLTHVTITENAASTGGGIETSGELHTAGSIVAKNPGGDCGATLISDGASNLDGDGSCFTGAGATHADPLLEPLGSYGGPTQTHRPSSTSPAINAADSSTCPATDQRGVARPQGPACDLGSVERESSGPDPDPEPEGSEQGPEQPADQSLRLQAKPRKVTRGNKTVLIARLSPCEPGEDEITFHRGSKRIGEKVVGGDCAAKLRQRVAKKSGFRAEYSSAGPGETMSDVVTVRVGRR